MSDLPLTLYRSGEPWVGETWGGLTWNASRDSGGLGTGIYAFRNREAAEDNIARRPDDRGPLVVLKDALSDPIQPRTWDQTLSLNDYGRLLDRIHGLWESEEIDLDAEIEKAHQQGNDYNLDVYWRDGIGGPVYKSLRSEAYAVTSIPEVAEEFGPVPGDFMHASLNAVKQADADCTQPMVEKNCAQPMNYLMWDRGFDGVAPKAGGAGGDSGTHGCLIYKQKVDLCLNRRTELKNPLNLEDLLICFENW